MNTRAEIHDAMKTWLSIGAIPALPVLVDDLVAPQFGYNDKGQLQLERKVDVKRRLGRSPDWSDALALTFAQPVAIPVDDEAARERAEQQRKQRDYDPMAHALREMRR
jgi:hypothetical protein